MYKGCGTFAIDFSDGPPGPSVPRRGRKRQSRGHNRSIKPRERDRTTSATPPLKRRSAFEAHEPASIRGRRRTMAEICCKIEGGERVRVVHKTLMPTVVAALILTCVVASVGGSGATAATAIPGIGAATGPAPVAKFRGRRRSASVARPDPRHRLNPVTRVVVGPPPSATAPSPSDRPNPPCCKK